MSPSATKQSPLVAGLGAALVVLSAGETRNAIGAAYGPFSEAVRLAETLQPIASDTGAAIAVVHPADPAARERPQPPAVEPDGEPGLPASYVAAELDRGKVTRYAKQPDTATLVAALTAPAPGYLGDAPTSNGGRRVHR